MDKLRSDNHKVSCVYRHFLTDFLITVHRSTTSKNFIDHRSTASTIPYQRKLHILDLPSLVYHRYQADIIEVYKFTHGIYTSGYSLLPRAPQLGRRGHDYKLTKQRCHSHLRANFFSFS